MEGYGVLTDQTFISLVDQTRYRRGVRRMDGRGEPLGPLPAVSHPGIFGPPVPKSLVGHHYSHVLWGVRGRRCWASFSVMNKSN